MYISLSSENTNFSSNLFAEVVLIIWDLNLETFPLHQRRQIMLKITFHWSVFFVHVCILSYLSQTPSFVLFVQIFRDVPSSASGPTNMQLNLPRRRSTEAKAPSCSERPLTLFHTPTHSQKGELNHVISLLTLIKSNDCSISSVRVDWMFGCM